MDTDLPRTPPRGRHLSRRQVLAAAMLPWSAAAAPAARRLTGYETPELTGEEWNHDGDPAPFLWRKPDRKAGE
ncbi:MAG TPA: hypothetical protein PLM38_07215 [Ottowia sp.]|nr:hypothetical protein [Ottowia sp.]